MFEVIRLSKRHTLDESQIQALENVSLTIKSKEKVAVVGASGSGKSTLLNILGLIDVPDSGQILHNRLNILEMSEREKTQYRKAVIGYVFQKFHLVSVLSALENVALPGYLMQKHERVVLDRARSLLASTGLEDCMDRPVKFMSGGQRQRVAIARAMMNEPQLILADEPTANLDETTGNAVLELLFKMVDSTGSSLVLVTHDKKIADLSDRQIYLKDGKLC